jgi:hypothetical protein
MLGPPVCWNPVRSSDRLDCSAPSVNHSRSETAPGALQAETTHLSRSLLALPKRLGIAQISPPLSLEREAQALCSEWPLTSLTLIGQDDNN